MDWTFWLLSGAAFVGVGLIIALIVEIFFDDFPLDDNWGEDWDE